MNAFTLMTVIAFVLFMAAGVTGPVNSLYVASLGANYVAIGLLGTVTSLTTILLSYVWGHASDRLGQRKIFLVLGLATLSVDYGLSAIVPTYAYLFPLRILGAVSQAAYSTSSLALMGDLLEQRSDTRGRRMGVFRGLCSLGFGIMAFLSGSIADRLSLRAPFGLAALFAAVAFLLALGIREPPSPPPCHSERVEILRFAQNDSEESPPRPRTPALTPGYRLVSLPRSIWHRLRASFSPLRASPRLARRPETEPGQLPLSPLLIAAFLWSLATGAVYAVWANYMVSELGYSQTAMSRLWALASTSEFPLMILAGWLSDRIGRLPMLSLGFLAWALVFLGYVFVPAMPWIALVQLTRGFAYSAFTATAMTYAAEARARAQRGRVSGLYSSAGGVGSILGSSLGGTMTQLTGFRTMIGTNAALILGGAVYLAAVAIRHLRRKGPSG